MQTNGVVGLEFITGCYPSWRWLARLKMLCQCQLWLAALVLLSCCVGVCVCVCERERENVHVATIFECEILISVCTTITCNSHSYRSETLSRGCMIQVPSFPQWSLLAACLELRPSWLSIVNTRLKLMQGRSPIPWWPRPGRSWFSKGTMQTLRYALSVRLKLFNLNTHIGIVIPWGLGGLVPSPPLYFLTATLCWIAHTEALVYRASSHLPILLLIPGVDICMHSVILLHDTVY